MDEKLKAILGLISGLIGIIFLNIILAPLAIYLGINSKKNDFNKLGNLSIFFGVLGILMLFLIPSLKLILGNDYPVSVMVSGSMEHKITDQCNGQQCLPFVSICDKKLEDKSLVGDLSIEDWWSYCGDYYENNYSMTLDNFESYPYNNGINIGDLLLVKVIEPSQLNIGDIIIFKPEDKSYFERQGPVPHRIVAKWEENGKIYFETKGDHNPQSFENFEKNIPQENVLGKVSYVIPKIGFVKIIYSNLLR